MSAKMKSRLFVLAAIISLLFSLAPQAVFAEGAAPTKHGQANSNQPGPMLVLSDIACVNGDVVAHFVVNKVPAGAKVTNITVGGSLAGGTVSAVTYNGNGQNAQFTVTLKGTGATTYNVQASVQVNGQTIQLHNAGNFTITPCGTPPPPPTGTLKVCKVLAAGTTAPAGTLFTFSVTGRPTPVSVAPGTCAELPNMAAGNYTVTETGPSGFTVSAISFLAGTGTTNVGAGSAVATVVANAVTEVQFTNKANTGTLKICKELAAGTTAPAGTLFTFSVTGRPTPVSVAPGTCAELTGLAPGNYTVAETGPSGYMVSAITFLAGTGTTNVGAGSAVATVVANAVTEVQFTNKRATGFVQICKRTTGDLTGTFTFTSPGFAGTQSITVNAGATQPVCGPLTEVTAGQIAITEGAGPSFVLTGVTAGAPGSLVNLSGMTATVNVPAGTSAQQVIVTFTNAPAPKGYIQICKATTGGLTGTFTFTSPAFAGTQSITVYPGATQPVCGPLTQVTAGQIAITEGAGAGFTLTGVTAAAPGSLVSLSGMTATVNAPAGTSAQQTIITFTNAPAAAG